MGRAALTRRPACCPAAQQADRLRAALRAGFAALLASFAVLTLFAAPHWAAQTSFPGHEHDEGTPAHTHTLGAVVGYALVVAVGVAVTSAHRSSWPQLEPPTSWPRRSAPTRAHGSRAPPLR